MKTHIKPHPNPPCGKPRFQVKSKMAANKPVIYIYFENRYHFKTKHRRATYSMSFHTFFFGDSIFSHLKFIRGKTEFIFKVKVKLDIKYKSFAFFRLSNAELSKMSAIKAIIYVLKKNHYHLRAKHRSQIIIICLFKLFFRDSICLHFKFGKGQTEVISQVKLSLKI